MYISDQEPHWTRHKRQGGGLKSENRSHVWTSRDGFLEEKKKSERKRESVFLLDYLTRNLALLIENTRTAERTLYIQVLFYDFYMQ